MREYLSHTGTHHSVLCPPTYQTGVGLLGLETTERVYCLLVLNLVSATPPCICQPGPRIRVLGVCDRVQVCTFLAFERLVNNASSATLAFSLRLVSFLPAADAPVSTCPPLSPSPHANSL